MGVGIAEVLARANLTTLVCDASPQALSSGQERLQRSLQRALDRGKLDASQSQQIQGLISFSSDSAGSFDLVVEAVSEDLSLKRRILGELAERLPQALLASNTSSLSLTEMASACRRPERVLGLHFFNPPPVMQLLEVVRAEQTSQESLDRALELARRLGKTPIVVRDVAGFASSRLGIILGLEAMRMVESGVATAADIDRAMELGYRHPMGPLKLTDLVGLDVRLAIAEHLSKEIGPQFAPPPLLRRMVRAGRLGKKTGQGFYLWQGDQALEVPS